MEQQQVFLWEAVVAAHMEAVVDLGGAVVDLGVVDQAFVGLVAVKYIYKIIKRQKNIKENKPKKNIKEDKPKKCTKIFFKFEI